MRILIVTGGHGFEREPFFDMFRSIPEADFEASEYPAAEQRFEPEPAAAYDVFVFFDFHRRMSDRAKRALLARLREGKPALFLHHALYNHADWPEYRNIVGGFWSPDAFTVDGATHGPSTYRVDVPFRVRILDPDHPVTQGVTDFDLCDEVYGRFWVHPDVTPLLGTDHPASANVIGWAHRYGPAPIVYLQPGDAPDAYRNPSYRQLVRQALEHLARSARRNPNPQEAAS